MSNVLFAWPNYADVSGPYTPTFSGGSWSGTLTLANLQDRRLAKVARSTSASLVNAQFVCDLKTSRQVRVFAIPKHNISTAGKIRIRGEDPLTTVLYDTGWLDVWPTVYPTGSLPSTDTRLLGKYTAEEALSVNVGFVHVLPALTAMRYIRVEIDDTTNAAGYIDLARLVVAGAYQPTVNMQYGAKLGYETETTRTVTDGGAAVFNDKPRRRTFECVLGDQPEDEALAQAFEMMRTLGTATQLFFVYNPADTAHAPRRSFLATLRALSPLDRVTYNRDAVPVALVEEL